MRNVLKVVFFPVYLVYVVLDKVSCRMAMMGEWGAYLGGPAPEATFPQCVMCGGPTFTPAGRQIFTTNRFGLERITAFFDCTTCGLRLRAIRTVDGNWTFREPN